MALLSKGSNSCCSTSGLNDSAENVHLAREWAISPTLVEDEVASDDSSKTWALRAKEWSENGYEINLDGDFDWTGTHSYTEPVSSSAIASEPHHLVNKLYADNFLQGGVDLSKDYAWTGIHTYQTIPVSSTVPTLPGHLVNVAYLDAAISAADVGGFDPDSSYSWGALQIFNKNISCTKSPTEGSHLVNRDYLNQRFIEKQSLITYGSAGYFARVNGARNGFDWQEEADEGEPLNYAANYSWTGQHTFADPPESIVTPVNDYDLVNRAYVETLLGGGGTPVNGMPSYSNVSSLKAEDNSILQGLLGKNVATASYNSGGPGGSVYTIVSYGSVLIDGYVNFKVGSGDNYVARLNYIDRVTMHQLGCTYNSSCSGRVQTALRAGYPLHVPRGKWRLDTPIVVNGSNSITITGDGPKASLFDVTRRTGQNTGHFEFDGSSTIVGTLRTASNMSDVSVRVSLGSGKSLKAGDTIIIQDPNNYSFSIYRRYYRAGEFNTVVSNDGDGWYTLKKSLYSGYRSGVNIRVVSGTAVNVSDFGFVNDAMNDGIVQTSSTFLTAFYCHYLLDSTFTRVHANYGNWKTGFEIRHSSGLRIIDCEVTCYQGANSTLKYNDLYALNLGGVEDVLVDGCSVWADKHSLQFTSAGGQNMIATRNCTAKNCNIHSRRNAMDMHSGSEHVLVKDCRITGGIILGTDWATFDGNTVVAASGAGNTGGNSGTNSLFFTLGPTGFNFKIINNIIYLRGSNSNGAMLRLQCSDYEEVYGLDCKGAMLIKNNHVYWENAGSNLMYFNSSRYGYWLKFDKASVHIHGNSFETYGRSASITMNKGTSGGTRLKFVSMVNNRLDGIRLNKTDIVDYVDKDNY